MLQNILILGDSGVGKTNIINRLLNKPFNERFISSEFTQQTVIPNTDIYIYDYPGQLKFNPVFPMNITKLIIVYDITSKMSYDNILEWRHLFFINNGCSVPTLIVGNKSDCDSRYIKVTVPPMISAKTNSNFESITNFIIS